uniref:Nucleolin n=1 Tax=Xiphophorus couchianus TaxID=32473 RepID=A0A3B5L9G7_9TELE
MVKVRRFGYVDFANEEDLNKALELNGKKFMGQEVKLDKARSKESSQEGKKERDARTLFVKNLPYSATIDDLKELFESAVDVRLPQGQTGSNRGILSSKIQCSTHMFNTQWFVVFYTYKLSVLFVSFPFTLVTNLLYQGLVFVFRFAFVEFENAEDAKEALENLNHTEIEGRSVRLEFSQNSGGRDGGRGNSGPTKTLFVKGLSEDTTDQSLKDSFEGSVGARIVTDRDTGASKGFGFVDFDNESDCKAAKEAMEDGEIDGSKVTLDYAKPKGEGGFRGGRGGGGGGGRGGFRGGRGGGFGGFGGFGGRGGGGFGAKPQGKKIKFDD